MGPGFGKPKQIKVGALVAACPHCRADQFVRSQRIARERVDAYTCVACGKETLYTTLLQAISDAVQSKAGSVRAKSRRIRHEIRIERVRRAGETPDEVSRDTLRYALSLVPHEGELAGRLGVSVARVINWRDGVEPPPPDLFHRLVDVIVQATPEDISRSRERLRKRD